MEIKNIIAPCICCYTTSLPPETLMSAKQGIKDKLQGSVAAHLSCGGE